MMYVRNICTSMEFHNPGNELLQNSVVQWFHSLSTAVTPGIKSQLCHLVVVWTRVNNESLLSLIFPTLSYENLTEVGWRESLSGLREKAFSLVAVLESILVKSKTGKLEVLFHSKNSWLPIVSISYPKRWRQPVEFSCSA